MYTTLSAQHQPQPSQPWEPYLLQSVVDSLHVRVSRPRRASDWLCEQVQAWRHVRDEWVAGQAPPVVEVPGCGHWQVRTDRRRYEWVLVNPEVGDVRIIAPEGWWQAVDSLTGQLYISIRSVWLQQHGPQAVSGLIDSLVAALVHSTEYLLGASHQHWERVSRIDLAADVAQPQGLTWAEMGSYVCRAKQRDVLLESADPDPRGRLLELVERAAGYGCPPVDNRGGATYKVAPTPLADQAIALNGALARLLLDESDLAGEAQVTHTVACCTEPQTMYFGRKDGILFCRRYDKLASLHRHRKEYMLDVWASAGWDGRGTVVRTEFSLSGEFLKDAVDLGAADPYTGELPHDLRELGTCLRAIPSLWVYLTRTWLRQVVPPDGGDGNVRRWPPSAAWQAVQGAWAASSTIWRLEQPPKPEVEQLFAQLEGCILTAAAKLNPRDCTLVGTQEVIDRLRALWEPGPAADRWQSRVVERRRRLGIDDDSDAALSARIRAEWLAEGGGS